MFDSGYLLSIPRIVSWRSYYPIYDYQRSLLSLWPSYGEIHPGRVTFLCFVFFGVDGCAPTRFCWEPGLCIE